MASVCSVCDCLLQRAKLLVKDFSRCLSLLQHREFSLSQAAKLHLWVIISSINYCVLPNYPLLTHSVGLREQYKVGKQWHLKLIGPEAAPM